MKQLNFYNVGIYCRLSKDDMLQGESSSILTQKTMLTQYVTERGWRIFDYYVDDGISGTTFERTGFKRLLDDIEEGKINLVITKDLSRLGRDYIKTGYYTEVYFPENEVRYIAVNDGIDTINNDNDIAPFKNILNEMYAKDISKKIKSAYKVRVARGDYHGAFAPFGYAKDPNNKGKLIIDPVSSQTVKLIFELAKQGYGAARIRNVLIERKLLTPSAYLYNQNPQKYYTKMYQDAPESLFYAWSHGAVERILDNEIYIGNIIHYKEISVSYKSKRRQNQPRDKWVRTENTHTPIIEKETWDLVQERFLHRGRLPRTNPPNIFQRIVRCADCGKQMWLTPLQKNPKTGGKSERRYFQCQTNREYGRTKCTCHNASYKSIYNVVLEDIKYYANFAFTNREELLNILLETENTQKQKEHSEVEENYKITNTRLKELELLLQRLFEENVSGRLNDFNYEVMFSKYQSEQDELKLFLEKLESKLGNLNEVHDNCTKWIELISKYKDLQELNSEIINELCERILIHEPKKINGRRNQKVEIFYRFVGQMPELIGERKHEIVGTAAFGVSKKK